MTRREFDPFEDTPDRPEYLHGCIHGYTALRGCVRKCSTFDEVLIAYDPGYGYGPIVASPEEYEASVRRGEPTRGTSHKRAILDGAQGDGR